MTSAGSAGKSRGSLSNKRPKCSKTAMPGNHTMKKLSASPGEGPGRGKIFAASLARGKPRLRIDSDASLLRCCFVVRRGAPPIPQSILGTFFFSVLRDVGSTPAARGSETVAVVATGVLFRAGVGKLGACLASKPCSQCPNRVKAHTPRVTQHRALAPWSSALGASSHCEVGLSWTGRGELERRGLRPSLEPTRLRETP